MGDPDFLLDIASPAAAPAGTPMRLWGVFMGSCTVSGLGRAVPSFAGVAPVTQLCFEPHVPSYSAETFPRGFPLQANPCQKSLRDSSADLTPAEFRPESLPQKQSSEMRTKSTKCQSPSSLLWTELFLQDVWIFLRGERIPHESF